MTAINKKPKPCQVVTDGPADGDTVLLPRVTEAEFKAKAGGGLGRLRTCILGV